MTGRRITTALVVLLASLLTIRNFVQDDIAFPAVVANSVTAYAGPGDTYLALGTLSAGTDVNVIERNDIGNWLHITGDNTGDDSGAINGWVLSGYLTLSEDFTMSRVPVSDLSAAVTAGIEDEALAQLYDAPILPKLSDAMIDVFRRGQELGNNPSAVVKVGDSNSANSRYLKPIASGQYALGPYDYLQDTVDHFGPSFGSINIAARVGLNAVSVFDPTWSHGSLCEPGETPLHCEYRLNKPVIAVVLFGQNDARVLTAEQFEEQMRRIIVESMDMGVIPLLVTFSSNDSGGNLAVYQQALEFNQALLDLAEEYEVPLLNYWSAARILPDRGITIDNAHLTGGADTISLGERESRDGVALLNLTVLAALDSIRHSLSAEVSSMDVQTVNNTVQP